jgi:uncharacterized SAM-binding protein YcdF (DUF218 family)
VNQIITLLGLASWKPYLAALLLPPVPLILLMLIGARLILPRRGLGWTVILLTAILTWLSATTGAATLLARGLLNLPPVLGVSRVAELKAQVQAKQPIAIVVLGGGSYPLAPEYGVSNLAIAGLERLRYGLWLGRETGAPVAFSGGLGWAGAEGSTPEGQIAQRIATQEFGRPLKWVEDESRDTRQNAALTVALMKQHGIQTVVLVTHDYHQPRALRAFEEAAQGAIRIVPAPLGVLSIPPRTAMDWLPRESGFTAVRHVLHEAFGRLAGA